MDFLFTGAVNWYRDLSLILQACIHSQVQAGNILLLKVVAVTPESGGSVVKNTSAVQEILIMGRKGRNRKRSARNKFPIGELARKRRLLKEEFVENCRVYTDERSKLSQLKRKVLTCRQKSYNIQACDATDILTYCKLKYTPALIVILTLFSVLCFCCL